MVGLLEQNWASIDKTLELIRKGSPTNLAVSIFVPHPGTKFYDDPRVRILKRHFTDRISCTEPPERYKLDLEAPIETDTMKQYDITKARDVIISEFLSK